MKRITAITLAALTAMQTCASAELLTEVTSDGVRASIRGTAAVNAPVSAIVARTGEIESGFEWGQQLTTDAEGAYDFNLRINPANGGGIYRYFVTGKEGRIEEGSISVFDTEGAKTIVEGLEGCESVDDVSALFEGYSVYIEIPVWDKIDKEKVYAGIFKERESIASPAGLYDVICRYAVTEGYNSGLKSELSTDGKLIYTGYLCTAEDEELYLNSLSDTGRKNVTNDMFENGFENPEEAEEHFLSLLYTNAITNNTALGIGNAEQLLIDNHELFGVNISAYQRLSASGRNSVLTAVVQSGAADSKELAEVFASAVKKAQSASSSSGSGGGGGGGGSTGMIYVAGTPEEELESNTVDNKKSVSGFADMAGYEWADPAVGALRNEGIVSGRSDTEFAPADKVTREEFLAMLLKAIPQTFAQSNAGSIIPFIEYDSFESGTVNVWKEGQKPVVRDGVLEITSTGGENVISKKFTSHAAFPGMTGDSKEADAIWKEHKVLMHFKMTLTEADENGYSEAAFTVFDSDTKVHLIRCERDGDGTFKVLINLSANGVSGGISNVVSEKNPLGTMIDACIFIDQNSAVFYINGEYAGTTKYSSSVPSWSNGVKFFADAANGTKAVGCFDDIEMYFTKELDWPETVLEQAQYDGERLVLDFSAPLSEYYPLELFVNGAKAEVKIEGGNAVAEIGGEASLEVSWGEGARDIFRKDIKAQESFTVQRTEGAEEEEQGFADISGTEWYAQSVAEGVRLNITGGISEDLFGVGRSITRQDMACMVFRALRYFDYEIADAADVNFADRDSIAVYAIDSARILKANGIISGYPDGSFRPLGNATRAEAAQMIYGMLEIVRAGKE